MPLDAPVRLDSHTPHPLALSLRRQGQFLKRRLQFGDLWSLSMDHLALAA
jgi:hypothetical protein